MGKVLGAITGANSAERAASRGQRAALASQERMQARQEQFLTQQRQIQSRQLADLSARARQEGRTAAQERQDILSQADGVYSPYMEAGLGGLQRFEELSQQPLDITSDPGYQFRLQQGEQAIQRRQAAGGTQYGGGALKELAKFSQGLASQEYGSAYNRRQQDLQTQMSLAQLGMGASGAYGNQLAQQAVNVFDPTSITMNRMGLEAGAGAQYTSNVNQTLSQLGAAQGQYHQNIGAIKAQSARSGFSDLMSIGNVAAGAMMGYGAIK